ncbi:hypothetical protein TSUD_241610 [Trifolium subterraneum]|uniref:Reverse transcriptase domain-containing protein n=1 Tax=Trifolium subterraneum TaxID=3900 RepID=A0A2Z6PC49_TRISU|nr:hypothetical protein TSUD_241610 [Trifolium subterraneum]
MRFISEFHRNGKLTKGINSTFIALIPKVDSPQRLNDSRPISLVGSLYKILAKVLANRLRLVIGSVISESQIAFVKDRQILDDILISNEVVDEARKSKKELMLFKVDFEKAYDSVDWRYLDDVMGQLSFPALWRKWIKECVCTATASVLVNGSPTGEFPLERGLRQGDPLFVFLFLLAAEGLHVLMEAVFDRHLFEGYNIGDRDPVSVSDLQFAEDTLLLGVKSWANIRALRAVLVLFETMSGLKLDFNKSILVGVNIPDSWLGEAVLALCWKWCWRMLVDREGLWFRVLVARYRMEGGRLREGGRRGSSWWREIVRLMEGGELRGADGLGRMFPRGWEMGRIRFSGPGRTGFVCGEAWKEEMLGECQSLFTNISLQAQSPDRWQWQSDPDEGYIVRGAYQLLTSHVSATTDEAEKLIWHHQVPLKVSIFAWRLLRDSGRVGTSLVRSGRVGTSPIFTSSAGGSRAHRSFMQLIWLACVWVVWTERNHRLFRGSTSSSPQLLDKIKLFSFRWLKTTNPTLVTNYHS